MPYINVEDQELSVTDFVAACDNLDIEELIDTLIEEGYISEMSKQIDSTKFGISEAQYEEALCKLHGKWNSLTSEEENLIIELAKKF
jgi:hypothetical protein